MTYHVVWSADARADLRRLFEFLLARELSRDNGDLDLAEMAIAEIENAVVALQRTPFIFRKAGDHPLMRELVIPFRRSGYVALFEILDGDTAVIAAVRHQREDDYH